MVTRAAIVPVALSTVLSRKVSVALTDRIGACERNLGVDFASGPRRRDLDEIRFARVEGHVNRVELDERIERPARRTDQRALSGLVTPEPACERRADLGVAKIELRSVDRRVVEHQLRLDLMHRARPLIVGVLGHETAFDQFLAAAEIGLRIFERRLIALRLRVRLIERRLKVARIDLVQKIAALDVGAVCRGLRVNVARHTRLQGDAADRFDPSGIVEIDRQRLFDDWNDRHRHRHHLRRGRGFRRAVRVVARDRGSRRRRQRRWRRALRERS